MLPLTARAGPFSERGCRGRPRLWTASGRIAMLDVQPDSLPGAEGVVVVDFRLEVVVVPVADVDRSLAFYQGLGWRLDADFPTGDDFRVVQLTPPGSTCSIIF